VSSQDLWRTRYSPHGKVCYGPLFVLALARVEGQGYNLGWAQKPMLRGGYEHFYAATTITLGNGENTFLACSLA
jgi:hypothetical protein